MSKPTGRPRGRPKGAKSRHTAKREKAMAAAANAISSVIKGAFKGDAHSLLMAVYKDPENEIALRVDAAKAAIRYEKPALAAVEHQGPNNGPIQFQQITRRIVRSNDSDA